MQGWSFLKEVKYVLKNKSLVYMLFAGKLSDYYIYSQYYIFSSFVFLFSFRGYGYILIFRFNFHKYVANQYQANDNVLFIPSQIW